MDAKINRRAAMTAALAATALGAAPARAQRRAAGKPPIVLHCDLKVDPARQQEMLDHFHRRFKPAAMKFPGFIDLKMLKLRTVIQGGTLLPGVNYRFQLTYATEELRLAWVASKVHADLWPGIENTFTDKNFLVALFDEV